MSQLPQPHIGALLIKSFSLIYIKLRLTQPHLIYLISALHPLESIDLTSYSPNLITLTLQSHNLKILTSLSLNLTLPQPHFPQPHITLTQHSRTLVSVCCDSLADCNSVCLDRTGTAASRMRFYRSEMGETQLLPFFSRNKPRCSWKSRLGCAMGLDPKRYRNAALDLRSRVSRGLLMTLVCEFCNCRASVCNWRFTFLGAVCA